MEHLSPGDTFEEHFYVLLERLGVPTTQTMLEESGVSIDEKMLTRMLTHSDARRHWRSRRPLARSKVVALRHVLLKTIKAHEASGAQDYLDVVASPSPPAKEVMMDDLDKLMTKEQLDRARVFLGNYEQGARERILEHVLGVMEPPMGVTREFDDRGRVRMYNGYLAPSLAARIVQELSA